jgi:hypothetical protein
MPHYSQYIGKLLLRRITQVLIVDNGNTKLLMNGKERPLRRNELFLKTQ